ncbi:MAG: cation-transporting P-type ATPase, partial [Hydrogenophaga sp.]|uniref:cation-transporting P-type ATPase n=2 Tax=Hydrogenophaga TaxID=47420 RepID=UPI002726E484
MPHDALRPIPDPASDTPAPPGWHAIEASQALQTLDSSATGLTPAEAAVRLATHGPNRLTAAARPGWLRRFAGQFNNVLIYVLLAAGFTTLWLEDVIDAAVIFGVVLINAVIGFI